MNLREFIIQTPREGGVGITPQVRQALGESGVRSGVCIVYTPHTTAGVTINENTDPNVQRDMLLGLSAAYPDRLEFRHAEGNSAAHLKASALGASQAIPVEDGRLALGTWQGVYLFEFDGPRTRRFFVKCLSDPE